MEDEKVAVKIAEHEKEIGSLKHRVKDLEEDNNVIHRLAISVNELANNMKSMLKEQEKQGLRIDSLEKQPAKRWETLVTVIMTAVTSALVGYILANLF